MLTSYRPVTNVPFLSKIIEKAIDQQMNLHLQNNALMNSRQSAYRSGHSVEHVLAHVNNEVLRDLDSNRVCFLALLDQSAAFDLVPHDQLLDVLRSEYGISSTVLRWFASYLKGRTTCVVIDTIDGSRAMSPATVVDTGVPQGSILGPKLFTCYINSISKVLENFNIFYHLYADDIQLLMSCYPTCTDLVSKANVLKNCLFNVERFLQQRGLKLNYSKTEIMLIGSHHNLQTVDYNVLNSIFNVKIKVCVRNLGVSFDCHMTFSKFVSDICKRSFYHLFNIRRIRNFISYSTCKYLICSLVLSTLDQCNSLLYGISSELLNKLQRVQNAAARVLTCSSRFAHITPVLFRLHWLPISYRIQFKILCIVYKCVSNQAPSYLIDVFKMYTPIRDLRSSFSNYLVCPFNNRSFGDRSFSSAGARMWNDLPVDIRAAASFNVFKKTPKNSFF